MCMERDGGGGSEGEREEGREGNKERDGEAVRSVLGARPEEGDLKE